MRAGCQALSFVTPGGEKPGVGGTHRARDLLLYFLEVRLRHARVVHKNRGAHAMATTQKSLKPAEVRTLTDELSRENRADSPVVVELQRQVANAFVLYANYKHYHWQTYGPLFRDLHKLFDGLAKEVLATIDELAERVRMIEEADRHLLVVIKEMRRAAKVADEHDDPGTVDVFSRFVQVHEKHEWWMRDILRTGDGLVN
jgi:starvation-inducible DNA-binding protein